MPIEVEPNLKSVLSNMINFCPYCGNQFDKPIKDGISQCLNCTRVFDCSNYHIILSAAWQTRKQNLDLDRIKKIVPDEDFANFVFYLVDQACYNHEELLRLLEKFSLIKNAKM